MGLLKTILIIVIIYQGFKILARMFAPLLMKKMVDKMQQKAEQQFGGRPQKNTVKEGETVIDKKPQKPQQGSNNVGEYVEFEEVD